MRRGWREEPAATGGCQCGAVRYAIAAGPMKSVVCHCRMCQRASGNAFAPLLEAMGDAFAWDGTPKEWASSDVAMRGFCAACGTPMYYRSGDTTEVLAGTLSPGFDFRPIEQVAVESRRDWVGHLMELPEIATPESWTVTSFQAPE
jgi:hypothetical protein